MSACGAVITNQMTIPDATISGVVVDSKGFVYICGASNGTIQASPGLTYGTGHIFVEKLMPGTLQTVYSTSIGGSAGDSSSSIAVDSLGNAYVTGYTSSPDFPSTVGSPSLPNQSGSTNVFVFKLAANGAMVFSRVIGGNGASGGSTIAVGAGGIVIGGNTNAPDFPTTRNAIQTAPGGGKDAFVLSISSDGSNIQHATYLGGPGDDEATSVGANQNGDIYVSGHAASYFPTLATSLAPQQIYGGFVSKIDHSTGQLVFSTYLPGVAGQANLQVDSNNSVYLTGLAGTGFPATSGADILEDGFDVLFLMQLDPQGEIVFATLVAGGALDNPQIALSTGSVVIASSSASVVFPATDYSAPICQLGAIVTMDFTLTTLSFASFSPSGKLLTASTYGYCQDESFCGSGHRNIRRVSL